jgi:NADPH:quinone reductase-like Zn-dependent oxidoreductase
MRHVLKTKFASMLGGRKAVFFVAKFNGDDMQTLRELLEAGKVTPVVDRRYPLSEVADAFRYLGEGHARGKVVITI